MTWHCSNVNLQLEEKLNRTFCSTNLLYMFVFLTGLEHSARVSYPHKYSLYHTLTSAGFCIQMRRTTLCSLVTSYSLLRCNIGSEGLLVIWLLLMVRLQKYEHVCSGCTRKLCIHLIPCGCGGVLSKLAVDRHTTALMATVVT